MGWYDEFRVWNTTFPISCIEKITLVHGIESGIWLPDVAIITADSYYALPRSEFYPVRVNSNGLVEFSPGGFIRYTCKMNLNMFPFDSMDCLARIESWFYTADRQVFDKNISSISLYNFTEHEQWQLEEFGITLEDVYYPTSGFTYGAINFFMTLRRKGGYYMLNIIVPSILMSTLELLTFILPPNQTIRIEVSFICLLAYTMFQSVIQADLPKSADQTPLLSIYITLMIIYIAIAITLQCIVMMLTSKAVVGSSLPDWLLYFVDSIDYDVTEIRKNNRNSANREKETPKQATRRKKLNCKVWTRYFEIIDKLAALLYFALIVVTSVAMLAILPATNATDK